jgi:diguanylate cyclase (GGDEF)-like protein/excisionase family DNA binding protein
LAYPRRDRSDDPGTLVSVAQAAALLGVHPNTVRTWTEAGRLPAFRINARGDRRFRRGDVERLLAEGAHSDIERGVPRDRTREAELAVLTRLAAGGGPTATSAAVARGAVEALRTHLGIDRVALYLSREGVDGVLRLETHGGYEIAPPDILERGADSTDEIDLSQAGDDAAMPSRLQVTLRAGGEPIGALVLEGDPGGSLAEVPIPFLRVVAGAVASDIQGARTLVRARREVTRAKALRHVTQELTGQLDLAVVLDDIADRTRSLFDADKVGFWLLEEGEHPFHSVAARGLSEDFLATVRTLTLDSQTIGVRAVRERRTFVFREVDSRHGVGSMQASYRREGIRTACLVPLVGHDRALGVIGLYHVRDREWPDDELALAQAFANQAAVAISNARLYRSVADQAARMQSIQDLSSRLNRLTDVQAIADAIVAEASTLAAYHDIRVYTVNWDSGFCEPVAYTYRLLGEGDFSERLKVPIGEGSFTGWVAEHGEPLLINDALADQRGHTIEGTDDIEESMLVVPMLFEGRSVGVIGLSKLGKDQFSTDDLQTMLIFAGYAAQAIANAGSYARLESQSTELARQSQSQRRLLEINERLLSTLDQQHVLETIADGLRSVVHYDNLTIYRADHQSKTMSPVLTRERHAEQVMRYIVPFGRGLMGWAVEHLEPVLANDALGDPRAMQIPGTPADPEALAIVPLVSDGEVIGSMNISRVGGPENYFTAADFELVKLFAGQASIALRNADTHFAVSQRADTDALTGQGNHGAFQRTLGELVDATQVQKGGGRRRRAAPQGTVSLLMMDLDRFKGYNDRLGHPAGDALLHAVGTAIYGAARSDDRVFRYGGDEFALVLPGVDAANAMTIGDRVRRAVARLTAQDAEPVTISVGVATLPGDAADKNDLIAGADTALYYGKQSGGDRVVAVADVPREMRDLRGTLDQLARTALLRPDEASVSTIAQQAVRLSGATQDSSEEAVLEALLGLARALDARQETTRGHADRVGNLAARMATELGLSEEEVSTVELAGRLHDVDLVSSGELQTVRSMRGASDLLRWYRLAGDPSEGPIGAQLVSVANAYDSLMIGGAAPRRGRAAAVAHLRSEIGQRFRAEAVEALATVVSARQHKGERRRGADSTPVEGAA